MAAVLVKGKAKLVLKAAKQTSSPAIGQALGQFGVNIGEFLKQFNAQSANYKPDTPVRVFLTAFTDRSFQFQIKAPTTGYLLMQCAGITKGADKPGQKTVGSVSIKHIYEIARIKQQDNDSQHISLESLSKSIISTAKSIGIEVVK